MRIVLRFWPGSCGTRSTKPASPTREQARRTARSLRLVRQTNGMTRLVRVMDPETAATITTLYDRATSPRRSGPRFVNEDDAATAERILRDARITEQLASDTSTNLLRHGATTDSTRLLDPVHITTVERLACAGPSQTFTLNTGRVTAERRTGTAALHHTPTHRAGCPGRRTHVPRLRPTSILVRIPPHQPLG